MEEKRPESISFIAFESEMARSERREHRRSIIDAIIILTLIVALVGSWLFFWAYESQFEEVVTTEITQENENGYNNYIGNDGDIVNGKTDY